MRDMCGLVPAPGPLTHGGGAAPDVLQRRLDWRRLTFKSGVCVFAVAENVACYLAFLQTNDPHLNFYNKFEAHALRLPGLDTVLLILAVVNSVYLFIFWTLVTVIKLDIFKVMAVGRVGISAACSVICFALVFFAESTKVAPFLCTVFFFLHLEFVIVGFLCFDKGEATPVQRGLCYAGMACVAIALLAWCLAFLLDGMTFLRDVSCVASKNRAMPVKIRGMDEWQCVRWGQTHYITHMPDPEEATYQAHCSTSFHAFGKIPGLGEEAPGRRAQLVHCPPQCQSFGLGMKVIGCKVYDARSSVCSAAVQMGVLAANQGGTVKVVGREPLAPGQYGRCNLNGVLSESTADTEGADATRRDWAFYFQDVDGMESEDMVVLHGWRRTSFHSTRQPWKSFIADVSWVIGGGKVHREEVPFGPSNDTNSDIQLDFCHPASPAPLNRCT